MSVTMNRIHDINPGLPEEVGLYSAADEHGSCGVGLVVSVDGKKSRNENPAHVWELLL